MGGEPGRCGLSPGHPVAGTKHYHLNLDHSVKFGLRPGDYWEYLSQAIIGCKALE